MIQDDDAQLSQRLSQGQALGYFWRVLAEARPHRGLLGLSLVGALLSALVEVALPRLMTAGIDGFLHPSELAPKPLTLAQFYLVGVVLSAVLTLGVNYGFNQVGQKVVQRLRQRLFVHFHQLPLAYFDGNPVGRLVTRLANDTGNLSEFFTGILANLLCDLLKLLVLLAALMMASPSLTLWLLLLAPPAFAAALLFQRHNSRVNRDIRRLLAQLNAFIQENLQGLATIKAYTAEAKMLQRFDQQNQEYLGVEMQLLKVYMLFRPLFGTISMLATAIVLGVGGTQVVQGHLSLGTLVLFLFYLKLLFAPLDDLAERFNVLQTAAVAAERIFAILDTPVEPGLSGSPDLAIQLPAALEFRDVHFAYDPAKPVLQGVSFRLEAGQTLALVGATGSGKTTITSLIQRIYPLSPGGSGSILLGGIELEAWPVEQLRANLGVIQQDLFLFQGSLLHNITLHRQVSAEQLQAALNTSRASQVVEAHPLGLQRPLGERGQQLSQGERQLVSFARALAGQPPILILDEATASVDSLTEQAIQAALSEALQGRSAIVVAHRLSTIQQCHQILVLEQGRIKEQGTHQQLLELDGHYAQLVRQQTSL